LAVPVFFPSHWFNAAVLRLECFPGHGYGPSSGLGPGRGYIAVEGAADFPVELVVVSHG
jgi:hypothetical protein